MGGPRQPVSHPFECVGRKCFFERSILGGSASLAGLKEAIEAGDFDD